MTTPDRHQLLDIWGYSRAMADGFTTKVVGRRQVDDHGDGTLQRTMGRLRGAALVPRGVYRFRTFEEADQWMITMMARTPASRKPKTSPDSAPR